jgi:hypothetical protein
LLPKTIVTGDGLGCFAAVTEAGCIHMPRVVGALKPRDLPEFKWINTVLGNLKTMMSGAFKALKYRKYAQTYLGAFAYRFNRVLLYVGSRMIGSCRIGVLCSSGAMC